MCVSQVRASVHSLHTCTSEHPRVDLYQKPKTLQSVLVSLVLCLDESNKIDKFFFLKKEGKKRRKRKEKRIITAHLELFL